MTTLYLYTFDTNRESLYYFATYVFDDNDDDLIYEFNFDGDVNDDNSHDYIEIDGIKVGLLTEDDMLNFVETIIKPPFEQWQQFKEQYFNIHPIPSSRAYYDIHAAMQV